MRIYFRFILLLIHLSQSMKSLPISNGDIDGDISNIYDGLNMTSKTQWMSNELLYIVVVLTEISVDQMTAYHKKVCTGIMIRNDMVLTLASCLLTEYHELPNPEDTTVFERDSKGLNALRIFINPNYYSKDLYTSKANDFGLIVIERSKQKVFPRLPQRLDNFRDIKHTCLIAGYGYSGGVFASNFQIFYLNRTTVEVFRGRACNTEDRLCLNLLKIMPCKGDQGSPIVCNGVLYAIYIPRYNSFSAKCVDIYITSFSPVYNVKDWVKQSMDDPTSNLEWLNDPLYVFLLCVTVFILMGGIYYVLVEVLQKRLDPTELGRVSRKSGTGEDDDDSENGSFENGMWLIR